MNASCVIFILYLHLNEEMLLIDLINYGSIKKVALMHTLTIRD